MIQNAFFALILFLASTASAGGLERKWPLVYEPLAPNSILATHPGKVQNLQPGWYTFQSGTATLTWDPVEGAESYHLQVATDSRFKWLVIDESLLKATQFQVPNIQAGQHYFWRVAAMRTANDAGYQKGPFTGSMFEGQ